MIKLYYQTPDGTLVEDIRISGSLTAHQYIVSSSVTNVTTLADGYIFRGKKHHANQFEDGRIKLLPDGKNIWLAAGDILKMKMIKCNM